MDVILSDVEHGDGERRQFIYALVLDARDNSMLISATLDYCLAAINQRGWRLVKGESQWRKSSQQ